MADPGGTLEWKDLHRLIALLCKMGEPDAEACQYLVDRSIEHIAKAKSPIAASCIDVDVRFEDRRGEVIIELDPVADLPEIAHEIREMGDPIQVRFEPPPEGETPEWDQKYAFMYIIEQRKVWFEFARFGDDEKLISATVHYTQG